MKLDLSRIASVESFASQINENAQLDIDILILNAGIFANTSSNLTEDGLGSLFQTNYFSHWHLTNLLLDRMKRTAAKRPVRIISVSSGAHSDAAIPLDDEHEWNVFVGGGCGYGQSKLLQIMHMKQLQKELDDDQMIQCVSATPGMVRTNIVSDNRMIQSLIIGLYPLYWYLSRNKLMGAETVLHAATNDAIVSGGYYSNCLLKPTKGKNGCSNDENVWQRVWKRTEALQQSQS